MSNVMMHDQSEQCPLARILIVEDDPLQQGVLASAIASHGYEVQVVSNGLDAIWAVRERGCDLMLVDYKIPEIDGLATARIVRDFMGNAACPAIIALTASPGRLMELEAISGPTFDGIVAKPVRLTDLLSGIVRCLEAAPNQATRRQAEVALVQKNWADYDTEPVRCRGKDGEVLPPSILVVEDDELQQLVLCSALGSRGYIVATVADGLQALRMVLAGTYDLVLIDYQLPEIDGLAMARLILDLMNEVVRPRLIGFTASLGRLNEMQISTGNSFDEVVAKSPDLDGLLAIVTRQLRSSPNPATRHAAAVMHSPATGAQ
jgi:two-component system, sensor histidine kinase and response regulator